MSKTVSRLTPDCLTMRVESKRAWVYFKSPVSNRSHCGISSYCQCCWWRNVTASGLEVGEVDRGITHTALLVVTHRSFIGSEKTASRAVS